MKKKLLIALGIVLVLPIAAQSCGDDTPTHAAEITRPAEVTPTPEPAPENEQAAEAEPTSEIAQFFQQSLDRWRAYFADGPADCDAINDAVRVAGEGLDTARNGGTAEGVASMEAKVQAGQERAEELGC